MIKIGYAICGSFCNLQNTLKTLEKLKNLGYHITVILSEAVQTTDTRFMSAKILEDKIIQITGIEPLKDIVQTEPIGPRKLFDCLVVCPCTSNTLGKLAHGITDGAVTMAVKSQVRGNKPVLLGIATNDGLSNSAQNIGKMLARQNFFFVPFGQDDHLAKPRSTVCKFDLVPEAIDFALKGEQIQPILI